MPDLFHNPYHFVPLGPGVPPGSVRQDEFVPAKAGEPAKQREYPHITHDRFVERAHSGRIVCKVTVETPLICGNRQEERGEGRTKLIQPFELKDGIPALPGSALRGMLSSLAEAASHSALRVLKGDVLSFRRDMRDPSKLSALGVIERHPVSKVLCIRPLSLPTLDRRTPGVYGLPTAFQGVFPAPNLKVYLGTGSEAYRAETFRDSSGQPLKNFTASADGVADPFYGMRLISGGEAWSDDLGVSVDVGNGGWQRYSTKVVVQGRDRQRVPNEEYLIGRRPATLEIVPWAEGLEQRGYTRGIYRALGLWTQERRDDRPKTKYHEIFIPFSTDMEAWPTLVIHPTALERFNQLADQRTEEKKALPFEPLGTRPNRDGANLRLQPGDVVYFRPDRIDGSQQVSELSFSSIWRGRVECADSNQGGLVGADTRKFFSAISPELLPLSPGRKLLTLAEQLFGVVEVRDKKQAKALENKPAFALASRLRISHGLLHSTPEGSPYQPHTELLTPDQQALLRGRDAFPDIPLKNLASPKPPSPALYFKPKAPGASGYVPKRSLNPADHVPHGRKFYLRRPDPGQVRGNQLFVHPDRLRDRRDREGIARQHQSVQNFVRPSSVFYFHLDFDNLSDLELQLIAYVLTPHSDFRHQIGHGKPLGLGQIHIEPLGLLEVNRLARYKETTLTLKRYQDAWVTGNPTTDWPEDLRLHVPTAAGDLDAKLKDLRQSFETWARNNHLASVLRALELLGNPNAVQHPVHYPQSATGDFNAPITQETAAFEKELFRWFVQNDGLRAYNQHLTTLLNATSLPTLEREPPLPPPGGQGGHRGFGGDPTIGGARRDDRRAPEQQTRPVPTKPPQGPQKGDSLTFKVAAHEVDKRIRFETNIEEQTWVAYLDVSRHDLARWLSRFPVGWVGQLTLQGTPVPGKQRMLSLKPPTS